MCLVLSWNIKLATICKANLLSQHNNASLWCNIRKSFNNDRNQVNLQQVPINALYSTSTKDKEIVFCLFVRQEIREDPNKTQ